MTALTRVTWVVIAVLVVVEGWLVYWVWRILRTVILFVLLWAVPASAQTSVILGAASKHFFDDTYRAPDGTTRWLNEVNPALAIEQKIGWGGIYLVGGGYYNSQRKRSFFLGLGAETGHKWWMRWGVEAAGVTGYQLPWRPSLLPVAAPYLVVGPRRVGVKLYLIPTHRPIMIGAIRLEVHP